MILKHALIFLRFTLSWQKWSVVINRGALYRALRPGIKFTWKPTLIITVQLWQAQTCFCSLCSFRAHVGIDQVSFLFPTHDWECTACLKAQQPPDYALRSWTFLLYYENEVVLVGNFGSLIWLICRYYNKKKERESKPHSVLGSLCIEIWTQSVFEFNKILQKSFMQLWWIKFTSFTPGAQFCNPAWSTRWSQWELCEVRPAELATGEAEITRDLESKNQCSSL